MQLKFSGIINFSQDDEILKDLYDEFQEIKEEYDCSGFSSEVKSWVDFCIERLEEIYFENMPYLKIDNIEEFKEYLHSYPSYRR